MWATLYSGIVFLGVLLVAKEYNSAMFAKPLASATPPPFTLDLPKFNNIYTNSAMPTLSPVPQPIPDVGLAPGPVSPGPVSLGPVSPGPVATVAAAPVSTVFLVGQTDTGLALVPAPTAVRNSITEDDILMKILSEPVGPELDIVVYTPVNDNMAFYRAVTTIQIYILCIGVIIALLAHCPNPAKA
jgi:hypothetical protein